ncbi:uncharacterized protein J4E84_002020 [Alternaria hordeiaustralica]|uniref:uncharacterized protein n=1 Tax=Alternaria hordeiaustralica TaxID=1187925 RepID=UPI0020C2EBD0|nr:uncharacterized protein J4E84_002020 [Alternaria hordeiaustralica]KAI4695394.1 hypothetical protein J4E84_002020 [Alternaria hordeiaustralica]
MGLLEDARRLADIYGPEAARHVASAADKAWTHGSAFGQEVAKRAGPVASDAKTHLEKLSKEAGEHAAPIAGSASKHAMILARAAYNSGKQGLHALPQVPSGYMNDEHDWKFITKFGEDMANHLGTTAGDVWEKLSSGDILHDIGQAAIPNIEFTKEDLTGFSERLKAWILANPKLFTTLLACIASGPIALAVTPAMLGLVGFTPIGIAAGSMASAFQAGVAPIAAGSAFAILTSAAMGGYGLAIVQAIVVGSSVTGTCGIAASAFMEAVKEDQQSRKSKTE